MASGKRVRFALTGSGEIQEDGTMKIFGVLDTRLEPAVTQGLREVEKGEDFLTVAWDGAGDADSWDVYLDGVFNQNVAGQLATISGLDALTDYDVQIAARNDEGAADLCTAITVTTLEAAQQAPDAPEAPTVVDSGLTLVGLEWEADENVSEWDVLRDGIVIATVSSAAYTDRDIVPEGEYDYTIIAKNAAGPSAESDPRTVVIPANNPPEWNITNKSGVVGDAISIDLNNESFDADGHARTYTKISGNAPGCALNGSVYAGSYTTAGSYDVVFEADDGYDQTQVTVTFTVAALPDTTKPTVPGNRTVTVAGASATFDWTESTDASGIKCYRLRKAGALIQNNIGGTAFANGVSGSVAGPPFTLTGLANGTYTDYAVRSVDGAPIENYSNDGAFPSFTINVAPPNPDVPVNFNVNATSSSATASTWQRGPNGPEPTRYTIERHDGTVTNAAAQDPLAAGWTEVFNALATSDTDSGLGALTTYTYRIRAFNGSAGSNGYAVDTVTTQASSGIVWPGIALQGGVEWPTGAGSVGYPAGNKGGNIALFSGSGGTGHPMDVLTEWTGSQGASTWDEYAQGGTTKFVNALDVVPDAVPIVHIWPLLANTEDKVFNRFERLRDGMWESYIHAAMLAMKNRVTARGRATKTIIFDLGHEMSGNWYAWSLIAGAAKIDAFHDAWAYTVNIIRDPAYFPDALICFRPARRYGGTGEGGTSTRSITLADMLPDPATFDLIGRSLHDENPHVNRNDPFSWNRHVDTALAAADNNIGMNTVFDACRSLGKKCLIGEWGSQISFDGGSHEPNVFGPTNGTAYWFEKVWDLFVANKDVLFAETVFQSGDSRLWGTRSNTATDPQLSARHEAAKATYFHSTRWGKD